MAAEAEQGQGYEGLGLAVKHGVHRRTVRQALADASPPARKPADREAAVFGPFEAMVRGWLTADLDGPGSA